MVDPQLIKFHFGMKERLRRESDLAGRDFFSSKDRFNLSFDNRSCAKLKKIDSLNSGSATGYLYKMWSSTRFHF